MFNNEDQVSMLRSLQEDLKFLGAEVLALPLEEVSARAPTKVRPTQAETGQERREARIKSRRPSVKTQKRAAYRRKKSRVRLRSKLLRRKRESLNLKSVHHSGAEGHKNPNSFPHKVRRRLTSIRKI